MRTPIALPSFVFALLTPLVTGLSGCGDDSSGDDTTTDAGTTSGPSTTSGTGNGDGATSSTGGDSTGPASTGTPTGDDTTTDDGSDSSDDESTGEPAVCGNGIVEAGEECESSVDLCVDCQWEAGNEHACLAPRVLVLSYDPGHASDTPFERDPDHLSACLARDMREATRFRGHSSASAPQVRYQIVDSIRVPGQAPQDTDGADFGAIYANHDICGLADVGQIDEVWMWGDPGGGFPEWVTTGPHYTKEWGTGAPDCARQLATMGFNYGVEVNDDTVRIGRAMHSIGHRIEGVLSWYFEGTEDLGNTNGGWYERWDGQNHRYADNSPPLQLTDAHCGSVHFPPNAVDHYQYNESAQVESDCSDWNLEGTGMTEMVDSTTWGCPGGGAPCDHDEQQYLTWWMQNLPGVGHPAGNWWSFQYETDMGSCDALTETIPADCTELGTHGGSRYLLCPEQAWEDGLDTCREIGEGWDMVAMDDMAENAFVANATHDAGSNSVWIGLSDRYLDTTVATDFVWSQCTDTAFTYFDSLEPNGWGGEDCVELDWVRLGGDGLNGHWNDLYCDWSRPIVCEGPA